MKLLMKNGEIVEFRKGMSASGISVISIIFDQPEPLICLNKFLDEIEMNTARFSKNHESSSIQSINVYESSSIAGSVPLGQIKPIENNIDFKKYNLNERLQIIDVLSNVIKRDESNFYDHTNQAAKKLLALVQII